jgi:S-adenosylmethionine hydrolase
MRLTLPQPAVTGEGVRGEVVVVDSFGNLLTNIPAAAVPPGAGLRIAGDAVPQLVRTYGNAEPGELVALIGSSGRLEVAVTRGSAAARLRVGVGTPVEVVAVERPVPPGGVPPCFPRGGG